VGRNGEWIKDFPHKGKYMSTSTDAHAEDREGQVCITIHLASQIIVL
jgi:hypothetical protein